MPSCGTEECCCQLGDPASGTGHPQGHPWAFPMKSWERLIRETAGPCPLQKTPILVFCPKTHRQSSPSHRGLPIAAGRMHPQLCLKTACRESKENPFYIPVCSHSSASSSSLTPPPRVLCYSLWEDGPNFPSPGDSSNR